MATLGGVRRLAAIVSLLIFVAVAGVSVYLTIGHPLRLVVTVVLFLVVVAAGWYAVSRPGARRLVGSTLAVVAVVAFFGAVLAADIGLSLLWRLLAVVVGIVLARYALQHDIASLKRAPTAGDPVPAATRGVLIMNLKSGGGKAERFHLADECRKRGIEPVVLQRGDDLRQLANDAVARGCDVIGMAGGDGSQALVASVAADAGIPMVVIPAGTRNHLALDLGIDRDDVVGALDAYGPAVERRIDLAEMNGRVFVNNVSLGLYATIVESPEYRDNKRETALAALPQMLGPGSTPFDLQFDLPDGTRVNGAHVVQVSNGPYGTTMSTLTSRPSVSTGLFGITSLVLPDDASARTFLRQLALGHPERYEGYRSWTAERFTVTSGSPIPVGLDGETLIEPSPLEFTMRPGVLRLRLAPNAIGASPAALKLGWRGTVSALWRTATGRS